jgi:hypothetical protein
MGGWTQPEAQNAIVPRGSGQGVGGVSVGKDTSRRLFLEDRREDEPVRSQHLRRFLRSDGESCGPAEAALMLCLGVWAVTCAKGHVHRVVFDPEGALLGARKLM